MTPLDLAHREMENDPDNGVTRLRYYEQFSRREVYILLRSEPAGDRIDPEIVTVEDRQFVLVFDTEERLAEFRASPAPYAALRGRDIVRMLQGQGMGIGVNLGAVPSAFLIAPDGVDWLNEVLDNRAQGLQGRVQTFHPPKNVPDSVAQALARCLVALAGHAQSACLLDVRYQDDTRGHLLAVIAADGRAKEDIQRAIVDTLSFLQSAFTLDVAFFDANDPAVKRMKSVALTFDIPKPPKPAAQELPSAPGMNPDQPPKLR